MRRLLVLLITGVLGSGLSADEKRPAVEPAQLRQLEKELAAIEGAIKARQTELLDLQAKADDLRRRLKDGGKDAPGSLQTLLEGLPENSRPRNRDDTIRLDHAKDWIAENVVGKRVAVKCSITKVKLERDSDSKRYGAWVGLTDPTATIGKQKLAISLYNSSFGSWLWFTDLNEDSAEKLQQLSGKEVTISGKVKHIYPSTDFDLLSVELGAARIEGFGP